LRLRLLQSLAQALDVFKVQLVLLLVHFQQRPQDFDAILFLHHTLSVFKLAYNNLASSIRRCCR
jgi:predicted metal-dependent HD superfamily phosphohydrolase